LNAMKPCIAVVLGTRPEAIKLLPVIDQLACATWCRVELLASGQQRLLLRQALAGSPWSALNVPPTPPSTSDAAKRLELLAQQLRPAMAGLRPDLVVVHGDTATAMAGALVAAELGLRIAHVEAGLRTYDLGHPYPEEAYRQAIAKLSWLHFAPTETAAANLIRESIPPAQVYVTGNTVVDALLRDSPPAHALSGAIGEGIFALVTLHRRELEPHLDAVLEGLGLVLDGHPELRMLILAHPNQVATQRLQDGLRHRGQVQWLEPLQHAGFLALLGSSALVITDSGGVQEEAACLGVPGVIVRKATERQELLASGRLRLAGFDAQAIRAAADWALGLGPLAGEPALLGDGQAARHIERALRRALVVHAAHG
jgi:UDP-N-acetylglucosamine 2-epimerase (non-hydrolysing)